MKAYKKFAYQQGFTLIELLIVIVIIVVLAAAAFVALDPATRFQDSRDATRYQDVTAIVDAIKVDQVDNGGSYLAGITALDSQSYYMIGTDDTGCSVEACTDEPLALADCVDLTALSTEGYIASIPTAPTGNATFDAAQTGYWIMTNDTTGSVTVGACESENTTTISVGR